MTILETIKQEIDEAVEIRTLERAYAEFVKL